MRVGLRLSRVLEVTALPPHLINCLLLCPQIAMNGGNTVSTTARTGHHIAGERKGCPFFQVRNIQSKMDLESSELVSHAWWQSISTKSQNIQGSQGSQHNNFAYDFTDFFSSIYKAIIWTTMMFRGASFSAQVAVFDSYLPKTANFFLLSSCLTLKICQSNRLHSAFTSNIMQCMHVGNESCDTGNGWW